jgi:hypothetical protein
LTGYFEEEYTQEGVTMKRINFILLTVLTQALAFVLLPMFGVAQSDLGDRIIYPPEFSPLTASRPRKTQRSLVPSSKFIKVHNAIPHRYIVVLNDDVVSSDSPFDVRRAQIAAIANSHAQAYSGKVGFVYETAIKGYSIELPNEAAALAISRKPEVKWVEEEGLLQLGSRGNHEEDFEPMRFRLILLGD